MPNHNDTGHYLHSNGTNSRQKNFLSHDVMTQIIIHSDIRLLAHVIMKVENLGWFGLEVLHRFFRKSYECFFTSLS